MTWRFDVRLSLKRTCYHRGEEDTPSRKFFRSLFFPFSLPFSSFLFSCKSFLRTTGKLLLPEEKENWRSGWSFVRGFTSSDSLRLQLTSTNIKQSLKDRISVELKFWFENTRDWSWSLPSVFSFTPPSLLPHRVSGTPRTWLGVSPTPRPEPGGLPEPEKSSRWGGSKEEVGVSSVLFVSLSNRYSRNPNSKMTYRHTTLLKRIFNGTNVLLP